jgi:hypothetical protein
MTNSDTLYPANLSMVRINHNGDEESFPSDYTVKYPVSDNRISEFIFHVCKDSENQISSFEIDNGEFLITVLYGIDEGWIGVHLYVNKLTAPQREDLIEMCKRIIKDSIELNRNSV